MTRLSPSNVSEEDYANQKARAIAAVRESHPSDSINDDTLDELIERFTHEAQLGWLDLEWFANIPQGQGVTASSTFAAFMDQTREDRNGQTPIYTEDGHRATKTRKADHGAAQLEHGLGSMFVDAVDYLSEERRRDYQEWKANVMKRIEAIESQQAIGAS